MDNERNENLKSQIANRSALSGWPMVLGWLGMIIFAFHTSTHMVGAGDTWVALACGRHFINHGVDTIEPFSAYSHKAGPTPEEVKTWPGWAQWITDKVGLDTVKYWHPTGWVNQNWLTHVIFYWLTHLSPFADAETYSFNTLVYWKFAVYILTVICVYYIGRLLGANPALSAVFACFAMFTGRSFFDIRPAGFSNLLVAIFLLILVLATYRNILFIWLIVPAIVFWCNVHGGYIYAFIMLVPFVGLHLLINLPKKWSLLLYNIAAWPFFVAFISRLNLAQIPLHQRPVAYLKIFFVLAVLALVDIALAGRRERLVCIKYRGLFHTIAAGIVAFIAMVIINPFHLTNLTHTYVISISPHAKLWRTVNEWHPGFEWGNPVGTGFPFLVLFVLCIGLTGLWLYSRVLVPRLFKGSRSQLQHQKELFTKMTKIFGFATVIFISWTVFLSLSFLDLNAGSFFVSAAYVAILLLCVYRSIHFIYLQVPLLLISLGLANPAAGYNGIYLYPFVLVPAYVILYIFARLFSQPARPRRLDIVFVGAAQIVLLIWMTAQFNPFKFTKPLWHIEQFLHLSRLFAPRYEGNDTLPYRHLFTGIYLVNALSLVVWLILPELERLFGRLSGRLEQPGRQESYHLPKIDPVLMVIAAMTVFMAVESRRFIPVAAFAACPILALLIGQTAQAISASVNFHRNNHLTVSAMPRVAQLVCILAGAAAVVGFGSWWGLKFKYVYLDPWPTDPKLTSVFMRMTNSDAKPFWACQFIKDNKFEGKMFNYWTEGGFIGWAQQPDPNTGKTPLKLFMDGRAQAAYDTEAYRTWMDIMAGGEIADRLNTDAQLRGRSLNTEDYAKIGNWLDERLQAHKAWVVLMPASEFDSVFVKSLQTNANWPVIYFDDEQKLFVDARTPQAQKLFEGITTNTTIYPDEYSRALILARLMLSADEPNTVRQGFEYAKKAFEMNPSQMSIHNMWTAASRFPQLRAEIVEFCQRYFDDFMENKRTFARRNAYHSRLVAAILIGDYLRMVAESRGDKEKVAFHDTTKKRLEAERSLLLASKKW